MYVCVSGRGDGNDLVIMLMCVNVAFLVPTACARKPVTRRHDNGVGRR